MPTIYHRNYQKLLKLIPHLANLLEGHYIRFEAGNAFMPLSVDVIERDRQGKRLCISLAHNFEMNGDLVPDPDMELLVDFEKERVEALTFQDQRRYQVVYPEPGAVYPALKRSLNSFLSAWLSNIEDQGFRLAHEMPASE
jgi:uncharacterized protein YqiB (DUF1249 family)